MTLKGDTKLRGDFLDQPIISLTETTPNQEVRYEAIEVKGSRTLLGQTIAAQYPLSQVTSVVKGPQSWHVKTTEGAEFDLTNASFSQRHGSVTKVTALPVRTIPEGIFLNVPLSEVRRMEFPERLVVPASSAASAVVLGVGMAPEETGVRLMMVSGEERMVELRTWSRALAG